MKSEDIEKYIRKNINTKSLEDLRNAFINIIKIDRFFYDNSLDFQIMYNIICILDDEKLNDERI